MGAFTCVFRLLDLYFDVSIPRFTKHQNRETGDVTLTIGADSAGAANAMCVRRNLFWHIKIDDELDVRKVKPTGSHVRRDKHVVRLQTSFQEVTQNHFYFIHFHILERRNYQLFIEQCISINITK